MQQPVPMSGLTREFRLSVSEAAASKQMSRYLIAGAVVLVGGYAVVTGGNAFSVMIATLIAAGLGGLVYAAQFHAERSAKTDRGVQIRVDALGFTAPPYAARTIPWPAINSISFRRNRSGPITLGVSIRQHRDYGLRGVQGWLAPLNHILGGGHLIIQVEALEGTPADVLRAIQAASPATLIKSNYTVS